jgi:hypothetical protein
MHTWGIRASRYKWGMNIREIFTLPKPYRSSMLSNLLYQRHMTVMYVEYPFAIYVTSSPDWARDHNLINTTEYDWPGLYYTRLGQTTITFNGTTLYTTVITHLAPSWDISHHWSHVLPVPVRQDHRLDAEVGLHAQVVHVVLNEITNGASTTH